jgi:membrane protein required for colicin V production
MTLAYHSFHFNWLDIILGGMLLFFICRSFWTGFSRSVASFLGIILGFWVAIHHFSSISFKLSRWIQNEAWSSFISFTLIFFSVYLVFYIAGIVIQKIFKIVKLGWFDRLLGAIIGLAKGLILAGAIVFMLTIFLPSNSTLLRDSCLYPVLSRVAQVMGSVVPSHLKGRFMWKWRKFHSSSDKDQIQQI